MRVRDDECSHRDDYLVDETTGTAASQQAPVRDPGLELAFAIAVAKPSSDAMYLANRDGRKVNAGWDSIERAVASGRRFTVDPEEDLLICDVDTNEGGAHVDELTGLIHAEGAKPVVMQSGRPGHFHIFARLTDARSRLRLVSIAKAMECSPRCGQRIRPPLSPHPEGFAVQLVSPVEPADALSALKPSSNGRADQRHLSPKMYRLLRFGEHGGRTYASRSEVVEAIALGAVNALWPEAWLFVALRDPRNRGGAKVQEMTDAEARRYVQLVFTKATEYVASHPLVSGRTEVDQAISTVLDRRKDGCWSGVAGATDHTVLGAHLAVARSAGSIEYSASDRQLAEVAGVRHDTVSRSNGRLIKGGWIHRVRVGKGSKASGWRVRVSEDDDRQDQATKDLPYGGVRFSGLILLAGRDAFRSRALGKNGLRVLEALAVETATASKLAKELKLDPSTVRRALNGLQDVGLVGLNTDRIWHVVSTDPTDLDLAAAWFGTAGRGERQRNEHNRDRESYLDDRLRRLANRTGSPKARSDQDPRSTACQTAADWKSA